MANIRNSAKAIIVRDERVLLTANEDDAGIFYLFPGGGQEFGEELKDAVVRECVEEIGCSVEVGELLHVREYIGANHEFADWDAHVHQIEFYFRCSLKELSRLGNGRNPDQAQTGVEWIELARLHEIRLYPAALVPILRQRAKESVYLGDTN